MLGAFGSGAYGVARGLERSGFRALAVPEETLLDGSDVHPIGKFNRRCLFEFGMGYEDATELPADWRTHPVADLMIDEIRSLLPTHITSKFVVSDPALCILFPLYAAALTSEQLAETKIIVCVDDPDNQDNERLAGMWLTYTLSALSVCPTMPRAILATDGMSIDAKKMVDLSGHPFMRSEDLETGASHLDSHGERPLAARAYRLCSGLARTPARQGYAS